MKRWYSHAIDALIDRLFWVLLSWWWPGWREALTIIQADTVLCWRRDGIAVIWKYRSRGRRRRGRPRIAVETRQRDGPGEFSLGCTTYSRRAAETRNHSLAGYRLTLHAGLACRPAVAVMACILTEPSYRDRPQLDFRRAQLDRQHQASVARCQATCRHICCNRARRAKFENVVFCACA